MNWLIALALAAIWGRLLNQLWPDWSGYPQYSYGWVVPLLGLYAFWKRVQDRPAPRPPRSLKIFVAALFAFAVAYLALRIVQEPNREWRAVSWLLAFAATGLTLLLIWQRGGGPWLRHFAFPVMFIFTAVPWPHLREQALVSSLMNGVAGFTVELLNASGIPAAQSGNLIEVGTGLVGIDQACSGIRSLQSTLMAAIFLGELYRLSPLRRALLVPLGLLLAFVFNLVRTFFLAAMAASQGLGAVDKFHDQAGLTVLFACVLVLWGISVRMHKSTDGEAITPSAAPPVAPMTPAPPLPRWLPATLLMFVLVSEATVEVWFRTRSAGLTENAVWSVEWPTTRAGYEELKIPPAMSAEIGYDEGGGGTWYETDGSRWTMYFFRWHPGPFSSRILARAHRPEFCLPAGGFQLEVDHGIRTMRAAGLDIPFRTMSFSQGDRPLHVFFCLWEDKVPANAQFILNGYTPSSGRLKAVWEGRREALGQQTIELIATGYSDVAQAEETIRQRLGEIITAKRRAQTSQ